MQRKSYRIKEEQTCEKKTRKGNVFIRLNDAEERAARTNFFATIHNDMERKVIAYRCDVCQKFHVGGIGDLKNLPRISYHEFLELAAYAGLDYPGVRLAKVELSRM
jgi:hypothetical protein